MQPVMQAVRTCLLKYFTFSGRARRPEYWWFMLAATVAGVVANLLDALLGTGTMQGGIINALVSLGLIVPTLAASWRRFHDIGKPGWTGLAVIAGVVAVSALVLLTGGEDPSWLGIVIMAIAYFGGVGITIWWLASPTQPGSNAYGDEPA
jgi:uncharacterized membrane protein YhaH (DUF805 family)